jgi:hypothetical protein
LLADLVARGVPADRSILDEVLSTGQNYLHAPAHVVGYVDRGGRLGMYSHWGSGEAAPEAAGAELEYYDYATREGRLELRNEPGRAGALADRLRHELIPGELQRPLPEAYRAPQQAALAAYWKYVKLDDVASAIQAMVG